MPPAAADVSLQSWLLGLLASGVVVVVGLYFRGILAELRSVAADLRELVNGFHSQDKLLALTVQRVDEHGKRIERLETNCKGRAE
jgi:hypothetical protein